jgi:hypothetical protein
VPRPSLTAISCSPVGKPEGHAFISYVREDSHDVDKLQRTLEVAGISVWRDTADLWPGEDWRVKIRRAITDDALVFIACFSSRGLGRAKSYQNEELLLAIDQLRLRRPDDPWLIPVRFDDCDIPDLDLGGGRTLASIQRVDLFSDRRELGTARLVAAILRILGQHFDLSAKEQAASAGFNAGTADESRPSSGSIDVKTRFSTAGDPLPTVSGHDSGAVEIFLSAGRYLVSWNKEAGSEFFVHDETETHGRHYVIGGERKPRGRRLST